MPPVSVQVFATLWMIPMVPQALPMTAQHHTHDTNGRQRGSTAIARGTPRTLLREIHVRRHDLARGGDARVLLRLVLL